MARLEAGDSLERTELVALKVVTTTTTSAVSDHKTDDFSLAHIIITDSLW